MFEVVAIQYNDTAPVFPIVRKLPEQGGTIGRADDNEVALPDPMRLLSRKHLLIAPVTTGVYRLTNISASNPAQVNDIPLAPNASCTVKAGDRICIGSYLLELRVSGQISPNIAQVQAKTMPPHQTPYTGNIDAILDQGGTPTLLSDDPLGITSITEQTKLSDLVGDNRQLLTGLDQPGSEQALNQDLLLKNKRSLLAGDELDPLSLFGGEEKSIDDLLGLSAQKNTIPTAASAGLLNELHTPFLPELSAALEQTATAGEGACSAKAEGGLLIPEEFSLDDLLNGSSHSQAQEKTSAPSHEPLITPLVEDNAILPGLEDLAKATPVSNVEQPVIPSSEPDSSSALLQAALLEGLNLKELPANRHLDADLMRTLGALLRITIGGTLDLMAARTTIKREVRANVTVIAPQRNNPLKFSPDADVALQYLLGREYPGFMGAQEAISEAFADLLSHQMGVVSGMRSALSLVLERFDPNTISRNANTRGLIDNLLAMGRKARLWDAYKRYFENTREQAVDRFQEFFGAAFVDAYEEYAKAGSQQKDGTS